MKSDATLYEVWDVADMELGCLSGAAVWVSDQAVVGSIPGLGVIKATWSTQPSIPPG